jgi:hypothetical protein
MPGHATALIAGETDPAALAAMAHRRIKATPDELEVLPVHRAHCQKVAESAIWKIGTEHRVSGKKPPVKQQWVPAASFWSLHFQLKPFLPLVSKCNNFLVMKTTCLGKGSVNLSTS